jgi:hypothetical protein
MSEIKVCEDFFMRHVFKFKFLNEKCALAKYYYQLKQVNLTQQLQRL